MRRNPPTRPKELLICTWGWSEQLILPTPVVQQNTLCTKLGSYRGASVGTHALGPVTKPSVLPGSPFYTHLEQTLPRLVQYSTKQSQDPTSDMLRLFSLEKRKLKGGFITLYSSLNVGCSKMGIHIFSQVAEMGREVMALH